jgi:hypothetical protein
MKRLTIIALAALMFSYGLAQAQSTIRVNIHKARLEWTWVIGAPPNDGPVEWFNVLCGKVSGQYTNITKVADPMFRSIPLAQVIDSSGNWYCAVTAQNSFEESGVSNEVNFVAGATPSIPTNTQVVAQ